jgi:hypothetical protein
MRTPLPQDLADVFRTRDAAAAGVARSRLRAKDLQHPFRGVYQHVPETADPPEIHLRMRAAASAVSDAAFFSHVTAAAAWSLPLPFRVSADRDLDVGEIHPRRPPRVAGVRGHRVQPNHVRVVAHPGSGLRIASPSSTWAMLGAELAHPYDLVAIADAIVSERWFGRKRALARLDQLEAAAFAGRRVGINALRTALPRVRLEVASRTETWTRLTIIDGGLPEPLVNVPVYDGDALIGIVDLAYPARRVAIEYEGEQHLTDPAQWAKDILRYERLIAAGWLPIRVTKDELFRHPDRLVTRVRAALGRS